MSEGVILFLVMVFATVFFLAQGLTVRQDAQTAETTP